MVSSPVRWQISTAPMYVLTEALIKLQAMTNPGSGADFCWALKSLRLTGVRERPATEWNGVKF